MPAPPPPPRPAARPTRSGRTSSVVFGVVAVVVAAGALIAFRSEPGSPSRPPAAPVEVEPPSPADELVGVCAGKPVPIARAAAYDGAPGRHRVEAVMIAPDGRWPELDSGRIGLPDSWNNPDESADVKLEEVELVGCYIVTNARLERTCDYQGGFTQQLWVMSGRIVVREAKTGKDLLRMDLPENPEERCGNLAVTSDDLVYGWGYVFQVSTALRLFSAGP